MTLTLFDVPDDPADDPRRASLRWDRTDWSTVTDVDVLRAAVIDLMFELRYCPPVVDRDLVVSFGAAALRRHLDAGRSSEPADLAAALYDDADRKGLIRLDTTTRKAAT